MKYSEELESMIASAVEKGAITDQERNLIVKKALIQGVDPNELEIYIKSLLEKRQQELIKEKEARGEKYEKKKTFIPDELDELIQEFLTDGVLTDKERQVILRKAVGMGLEHDEIDLYLDAQVQKIDQATDAAVRRQKGKTCPYCGAAIPLLTDKCPECGQFITPEASDELKEIIDNLEEALINFKSGKDFAKSKATVERYARKAKMYYGSNPKIQKLLAEIDKETYDAEKRMVSIARKNTFVNVIRNKWLWCLIEIVVFGILFSVFSNQASDANKRLDDLRVRQWAHPDDNNHETTKSMEYVQIMADKNKAWDELKDKDEKKYLVLVLGFVAVGVTAGLAIKGSKK